MRINNIQLTTNQKNTRQPVTKTLTGVTECVKSDQITNNNFNKYLVNFTGATDKLKRKACQTALEVKEIIDANPKSNGIIGTLPEEWEKLIDVQGKKEKVKEFYKKFGEFISIFRQNEDEQIFHESLNNLFRDTNIIGKQNSLKVNYLGSGSFGDAYLLDTQDDKPNFVIKIFKEIEFNNFKNEQDFHGSLAEINKMAFWNEAVKPLLNKSPEGQPIYSQKTRFYFGDTKNGYVISEYSSNRPYTKIYDSQLGLENRDTGNLKANIINNLVVDFGGLSIESPILAKSKRARDIYAKFLHTSPSEKVKLWDGLFAQSINEIQKNNDSTLIQTLAECVNTIGANDKRISRIKKLLKVNISEVSQIIAKNSAPKEFQSELFNTLISKKDPKVNTILAKKLSWTQNINIPKAVQGLYEHSEQQTIMNLIDVLHFLPANIQTKWYQTFSQIDDYKIQLNLIHATEKIAPQNRAFCLEQSLECANVKTLGYLLDKLDAIETSEKKYEIFKTACEKFDTIELEPIIAKNLYRLNINEIMPKFEQLMKSDNTETKIALSKVIRNLPANNMEAIYNQFLAENNAQITSNLIKDMNVCLNNKEIKTFLDKLEKIDLDFSTKYTLASNIDNIDDKKLRAYWFDKLLVNSNSKLKKILADNINKLDFEDKQIFIKKLKSFNIIAINKSLQTSVEKSPQRERTQLSHLLI